jgi:hypothetical protein
MQCEGRNAALSEGMRIAAIACHEPGIGVTGRNHRIVSSNHASASARAEGVRKRDRIPFVPHDGQPVVQTPGSPAGSRCWCARGPLSSPSDYFTSPGVRFKRHDPAASKSTLNCSSRGCNPADVASGSLNRKLFRRKSLPLFPRLTYSPPNSSRRLAAIIKVEALRSLREKYVDEKRQFIVFSSQCSFYRLYRQKTGIPLWAPHFAGGRELRPRAAACPKQSPRHALDFPDGARLSRKKL